MHLVDGVLLGGACAGNGSNCPPDPSVGEAAPGAVPRPIEGCGTMGKLETPLPPGIGYNPVAPGPRGIRPVPLGGIKPTNPLPGAGNGAGFDPVPCGEYWLIGAVAMGNRPELPMPPVGQGFLEEPEPIGILPLAPVPLP